jgi:hypothetical protein
MSKIDIMNTECIIDNFKIKSKIELLAIFNRIRPTFQKPSWMSPNTFEWLDTRTNERKSLIDPLKDINPSEGDY